MAVIDLSPKFHSYHWRIFATLKNERDTREVQEEEQENDDEEREGEDQIRVRIE